MYFTYCFEISLFTLEIPTALAIVCLVVPAQYYFGFKIIRNKMLNAPNVNERYSIIQELLPAMKLVKYYAWEQFFEKEVNEVRGFWFY